jgi:lysophospholipase L1-like esterase
MKFIARRPVFMSFIQDHDVVLFQGDSITDCGRNREKGDDLGKGYALMAAGLFGARYPEKKVTFLNRGIGGNRVKDLVARWQQDCIDLHPTCVSIYIGINDTWRRFDRDDPTSAEDFESGYRQLLESTRRQLNARLILIEPFVLPVPEDRKRWREDLDPKIHVVRELAREYGALLVPLDGLFAQACVKAEPKFWAHDGVHPSPAGHALIAKAWLDTVDASR